MEEVLNKENPVVRIRAFRAIDDPETCALFIKGHTQVLTNFGILKITSAKQSWINNPASFVIIVESLDKKIVYGGGRIHVSGGSEPLPIELAIGGMDPFIHELIWQYAQQGTGESCGIWNSREIAGYGIGSIFLSRAGLAIASQVGIKSLFALCAPYTVKFAENLGYRVETRVGNNGTFYYPKLDLLATCMIHEDLEGFSVANDENRKAIIELRENLVGVRTEILRKKKIEIFYELKVQNLDKWNLQETILNTNNKYNIKFDDQNNLNLL